MSRIITRFLIIVATATAICVVAVLLYKKQDFSEAAWAILAAALAVITSAISAWNAQRVVELEEDRLRPYPYPCFDTTSRYGLILLRVRNSGQSTAYKIKLKMNKPLLDSKGKEIKFGNSEETSIIPVLFPGHSISKTVDGHVDFYGMQESHKYTGEIEFQDAQGKVYRHEFILDAEMYKNTPLYSEEQLKTAFELQKIPGELVKINRNLGKMK